MDTRAAAFYRPELQALLPLFLFENAARLDKLTAINLTHKSGLHVSVFLSSLLFVITTDGREKGGRGGGECQESTL